MSMMNICREFGRAAMNRAQRGLYAGREVTFGNNVSFSERKTRREWKPNAQYKALFSDVLGESVRLRVTTHALRCIDKAGGLDAYLLNTRKEKLDSQVGVKLKRYLQVVKSAQEPEAVTPGQAPQA